MDPEELEHLNEALDGHVEQELSTLSSAENHEFQAHYGQALEVYAPVWLDGQVVGAFEIYQARHRQPRRDPE